MNKLAIALMLMLCISLSFAWTDFTPPSCISSYSLFGYNFTYSVAGQNYSCSFENATLYGTMTTNQVNNIATVSGNIFSITKQLGAAGTMSLIIDQPRGNTNGTLIGGSGGIEIAQIICLANTSLKLATSGAITIQFNATVNSTDVFYSNGTSSFTCPLSSQLYLSATSDTTTSTTVAFNMNGTAMNGTSAYNEILITAPSLIGISVSSHYLNYNNISGKIIRSDFKTGFSYMNSTTAATYGKAIIYYGSSILIPKITYIPGIDIIADFYNATSNVAYVKNNTVIYVLDSLTNQWYIVPATAFADTNIIYIIQTIFYNAGSVTTSFPLPNLPLQKACFQNGDQYTINSLFSSSVNHIVYYDNGTSFLNYNTNAATLNYSVNTTLYPNVNYTVNGFDTCLRNNSTSLMGLTAIGIPSGSYTSITWLLFLGSIGIALAVPFAIVFPILLNEMFSLMTLDYMAETVVLVGVVSVLLRGSDKNTVKASIVYFLFGIVILAAFFAHSSLSAPDFTGAIGNMTTIIQDPTKADIGTFVVGAPNFIVAIFGFALNLPSLLSSAIFTPLALISPPIYSFLSSFLTVFIYGAYVYILLVAWEKIANRFQQV